MNIQGKDKAHVLIALYNRARAQRMGILHAREASLLVDEARELLKQQTYFDYLYGRVMKIDLSSDELETSLYNRDNGFNAAESAIEEYFR